MSATEIYKHRLGRVKSWLRDAGWTPHSMTVSLIARAAVTVRARAAWYPTRQDRAEAIVRKAEQILRGEPVREAGAPRRYARFRAGQNVLVSRRNGNAFQPVEHGVIAEMAQGDGADTLRINLDDGYTLSIAACEDKP